MKGAHCIVHTDRSLDMVVFNTARKANITNKQQQKIVEIKQPIKKRNEIHTIAASNGHKNEHCADVDTF